MFCLLISQNFQTIHFGIPNTCSTQKSFDLKSQFMSLRHPNSQKKKNGSSKTDTTGSAVVAIVVVAAAAARPIIHD